MGHTAKWPIIIHTYTTQLTHFPIYGTDTKHRFKWLKYSSVIKLLSMYLLMYIVKPKDLTTLHSKWLIQSPTWTAGMTCMYITQHYTQTIHCTLISHQYKASMSDSHITSSLPLHGRAHVYCYSCSGVTSMSIFNHSLP